MFLPDYSDRLPRQGGNRAVPPPSDVINRQFRPPEFLP